MIARALAQDPEVLLLDEPTAHLDIPNRLEVMRVLRELAHAGRRAVLLSTHELDLALQTADRVAIILPGGKLRTGLPEALVLDGTVEEAFGARGAGFDPASGTFRLRPPHGARIGLRCADDGLRLWTRRALERTGWTVALDAAPEAGRVEAWRADGGARWRLVRDTETREFDDLEPLLQYLNTNAAAGQGPVERHLPGFRS